MFERAMTSLMVGAIQLMTLPGVSEMILSNPQFHFIGFDIFLINSEGVQIRMGTR